MLNCLDAERPSLAKGTLNAFRTRLIETNMDRRLMEKLHIDRAYPGSHLVREREPDLAVFCRAWRVHAPGDRFAKTAFTIDSSPNN